MVFYRPIFHFFKLYKILEHNRTSTECTLFYSWFGKKCYISMNIDALAHDKN